MAIELPTDYYLKNFMHLLEFVKGAYNDLLSDAELQYADSLLAVPEPALRLYIRLLCRSKTVFRQDKLNYPEIVDLPCAALALEEAGLLIIDPELELPVAITLLTKPEIIDVFGSRSEVVESLPALRQLRRGELEDKVLCSELTSKDILSKWIVYQSLREPLFDIYKLCFFGNLYQDMTDYVLRDLGMTQFENYQIGPSNRAFESREQLEAHQEYFVCAAEYELIDVSDTSELLTLCERLPKACDPILLRRTDRLRNRIARELERQKQYPAALELFALSTRPPARERRARILANTGQVSEALDLCKVIIQAPLTEEELQIIMPFAARLAKRHDVKWPALSVYKPTLENVVLPDSEYSVEQIVAAHLANAGSCFYTENTLFNGVFGLVFWDIIFAPVKGAFYNPFQSAPADFYEPVFYETRAVLIDQRIQDSGDAGFLADCVNSRFREKAGIQNTMIYWPNLTEELLTLALTRIPTEHWVAVFKRLLKDLRNNRTGFPDLIHFPDEGGYELIEVKGPGDSLQKNQLRWMEYFNQNHIPHQVCHVEWAVNDEHSA